MSNVQLRGFCQMCGHEQAVVRGHMAHHGYTVENGFFQGTCSGHAYAPIQEDRKIADQVIASVWKQVHEARARADALEEGRAFPTHANSAKRIVVNGHWQNERCAFADAPEYYQREEIRSEVYRARQRAKAGREFATFLQDVVDAFHGKPLREVERTDVPAPIHSGEKRKTESGRVLRARYVERGRVHWQSEDERKMRGWTGTQKWRKMEVVA